MVRFFSTQDAVAEQNRFVGKILIAENDEAIRDLVVRSLREGRS